MMANVWKTTLLCHLCAHIQPDFRYCISNCTCECSGMSRMFSSCFLSVHCSLRKLLWMEKQRKLLHRAVLTFSCSPNSTCAEWLEENALQGFLLWALDSASQLCILMTVLQEAFSPGRLWTHIKFSFSLKSPHQPRIKLREVGDQACLCI